MSKKVIYDIFSVKKNDFVFDNGFIWPNTLNDYKKLSTFIYAGLQNILINKKLDSDVYVAFVISLTEIMLSAEKTLKTVLDITKIKKHSFKVKYDSNKMLLFHLLYFSKKVVSEDEISIFFQKRTVKNKNKISKIIRRIFFEFRFSYLNNHNRFDINTSNELMNEFIEINNIRKNFLRTEYWSWPNSNKVDKKIEKLTFQLVLLIKNKIKLISSDPIITNNAINYFSYQVKNYLSQSFLNLKKIDSKKVSKTLSDNLLGGSPKETGRLLNYMYQNLGKKVIRFSHGGDRVFFKDKLWIFSELPYLNQYYCHSSFAAKLQNQKYKKEKKLFPFLSEIKFKSEGSIYHQKIWEKNRKISFVNNKKKLLIVSGNFLGEEFMGSLEFKTPDVLTFEFIIHLYKYLSSQNFDVYIKIHPKGVIDNPFYKIDKSIKFYNYKNISPAIDEMDCYIFEFAGSAFYDALLSNKGIILFDTKIRPWFKSGKELLSKRCHILNTYIDKYNRIRFKEKNVSIALDEAFNFKKCEKNYAKLLF